MDHEERADELEREVDKLEQHTKHVGDQIESTRKDWESKQEDQDVPGAQTQEALLRDEDEGDSDDDAEVGEE
jgi:hypothetical protein